MSSLKGLWIGIVGGLALAVVGSTAEETQGVLKTAVKPGQEAPSFKLPGSDGRKHTLKQLLPKGDAFTALLFFRSADW